MKIHEQILGFRGAAKLYITQLENRVNSTQLHELGAAAGAMGDCEAGPGAARQAPPGGPVAPYSYRTP